MVQQTVGSKTRSCFVSLSKGTALSLIFFGRDTFIAQRDAHEDLVQNEYWVDARTRVMNNVMEVLCLMLKSFSEHDCAQKSTSTFPDIGSFC